MPAPLRLSVLVILSLLGSASIAHAGDPFAKPTSAQARGHLDQGNKLYDLRRFDAAAEEYKAGALAEPAAIFDYNLGQCYRLMGKYDDSIWFYQRFINRGQPTGKVLDAVNEFIAQMKAEQQKAAMTAKPTEPAPTTPTAAPATAKAMPAALVQPQHRTDVIGISLGAAGGVAVGVGVALWLDARSLNNDADKTTSQQERDALHSKADTRSLVGTTVVIGGAVLVGAAIIEHVLRRDPAPTDSVVAWHLGASQDSVFVFGHF